MDQENIPAASSRDFYNAFSRDYPAQPVRLPKLGKAVLLRRPSPMWFIFHNQLPGTLAARLTAEDHAKAGSAPAQEAAQTTQWVFALLQQVMVQPRVSLTPTPEEISPDLIAEEDLNFIIRWAYGEVASDGSDLASFRAGR